MQVVTMKFSGWGAMACAAVLTVASAVGTAGQAPADAAARRFAEQAMMANVAEVKLGEMAVTRAQSPAVKEFAQMMVRDHTKAKSELQQAVKGNDVKEPTQLDTKHQALYDRLNKLNGAEFDREYMMAMVDGHRDVKAMVTERADRKPAATGTSGRATDSALDKAVNQWATKALPVVTHHLQRAEEITKQSPSRPAR
jgi:putative membrane protein